MAYCKALDTLRPDDVRWVALTTRSRGLETRGRRNGSVCLLIFGEGGRGISVGFMISSSGLIGLSRLDLLVGDEGSWIDLGSSIGPGEGIVSPVRGVGGVVVRLTGGESDMVLESA